MTERTVTVYEIIYHVDDDDPRAHGGAAGDGSFIYRTRDLKAAERFAASHYYYGRPCQVKPYSAPVKDLVKRIMVIVRDDLGLPRAWATGTDEAEVRKRADAEWDARIARRKAEGTLDPLGGDTRGETTVHDVPEEATGSV